jgi:hypothetical protein
MSFGKRHNHSPLIPAKAGTQSAIACPKSFSLDPRLRGDERMWTGMHKLDVS